MAQTLFVTGTDTDIGKSFISACLVNAFLEAGTSKVAYYKPVQTGVSAEGWMGDDAFVRLQAQPYVTEKQALTTKASYSFKVPAAPSVADVKKIISIAQLDADLKALQTSHDVVIVEGAGGLMVPITNTVLLIDWLATHKIPTVLVAANKLGTINHTLLSLEALTQRDIPTLGVILNQYQKQSEFTEALETNAEQLQNTLPNKVNLYSASFSTDTKSKPELIQGVEQLIQPLVPALA